MPDRPNNIFVTTARRGVAKKIVKVREYGNERLTSYVVMDMVNEEGTEVIREDMQVRARDVIDFWDSYYNERRAILKDREEKERLRQQEWERRRLEREAYLEKSRQEKLAFERAEAEKKELLINKLVARTGMPRHAIHSVGPGNILLDKVTIERWLGINVITL
jgi:hypothetical protein